ncbi:MULTISPECIES: hypothetical protein [Streptomyces]|uniref:hypothetical protein n=1 Tax=Streptomyces TaxID=1883 RepID=UPI0011AB3F46|nr:hypothetical protein [Streptomyces venezuelae]
MGDRRRKFILGWSLIAGVIVLAVVSGALFFLLRSSNPPLAMSDVEGVWRAEGGEKARVLIRVDGTADLADVPDGCLPGGGGHYSGPANWEFDTVLDESPGVRFTYERPDASECSVYFAVPKPGEGYFIEDREEVNYVRDSGGSK